MYSFWFLHISLTVMDNLLYSSLLTLPNGDLRLLNIWMKKSEKISQKIKSNSKSNSQKTTDQSQQRRLFSNWDVILINLLLNFVIFDTPVTFILFYWSSHSYLSINLLSKAHNICVGEGGEGVRTRIFFVCDVNMS